MDRYRSLNTLDNAFKFDFLSLHLVLTSPSIIYDIRLSIQLFLFFFLDLLPHDGADLLSLWPAGADFHSLSGFQKWCL